MSHVDEGTLHAYIDGELSPAERAAFDAHIAQCTECSARLGEAQSLVQRARQLMSVARPEERPAPPLEQLRVSRRSLWQVRTPFAWAASIALALSVGYYMRGTESPAPQPPPLASPEADRLVSPAAAPPRAPSIAQTPRETRRQQRSPQAKAPTDQVGEASRAALARARDSATSEVVVRLPAAAAEPAPAAANVAPRLDERMAQTEWPFVSLNQARQMLGSAPLGVPALPVRGIRRNPAGDGSVVVEQEIDESTVIQLFQRSVAQEKDGALSARDYASARAQRRTEPAGAPAPALRGKTERLARFVGSLRVEIAGPLPEDSLNRLLEQVKPLP